MIGLNTRSNRESIPGYRDNYVKCKCSKRNEEKAVRHLHHIGALEINIGNKNKTVVLHVKLCYLACRTSNTKRNISQAL